MVMMPEPLFDAVEAAEPPRPLLSAVGERPAFDQSRRASSSPRGAGFSLFCGRYEGVDQRVADHLCDGELSVGDYVLAGGEAAALVVIEAVARLLPGVHRQRRVGGRRVVQRRAGSSTRSTPGPPSSGAGRCPRCCGRATTRASSAGGGRRRCAARSGGRTCSHAAR